MKHLRIIFCVLACISVAAVIPVGVLSGSMTWALIPIAAACAFVLLMLFAKNKSEPKPPAAPDFMNTPEENAELNRQRAEWDQDKQ